MTRKEIYSLIILILVIGYGVVRYVTREYTEIKSQYLLDTIVEISASSQEKNVGDQVDDVFAFIKQLQQKFDEWNPNSWIYLVNNSTDTSFPMDSDAYEMLVMADSLYRFSEGGFDITIKPVFDLWKYDTEDPAIPDSSLIKATLVNTGFSKIRFDKDRLYKPAGMQITFGALAKGYILDKSKEYMISKGLSKGYINCRSSMTFFGSKIPQIVYVQHPRRSDDIIASFKIKNLSVGTSGDYQQYFEVNGKRYHHIINPFTGYPVEHVYSLTVLNSSAAWSDGLSTALFIMNPNLAVEKIKTIPNSEALIYFEQNGSIVSLKTQGMKAHDLSEKL